MLIGRSLVIIESALLVRTHGILPRRTREESAGARIPLQRAGTPL
jgi:hypothetical protein